MSFFDKLGKFFKAIGRGIADVFKDLDGDKIESIAKRSFQLAKWAIPAAQLVASYTPTQIDDELLKAAAKLSFSLEEIFTSTNDIIHDGGRQHLAAEVLKNKMIDAINRGVKIKFDDVLLETVEDVMQLDRSVFLSAAQAAHDFRKYGKKAFEEITK